MKNTTTPTLLLLLLFSALIFTSCDSMNDTPPVQTDLSVVEDDAAVSMAFEDLDNLTLTVLSSTGFSARTTVDIPTGKICDGSMISIDEETKKITVDFGDGCTSSNGVTRKGIIIISYTANLLFPGAKVTTTFDGYEVDGLKVVGTRTITNVGVDADTNTISVEVKVQNGKVTWSDDTYVTYSTDQMRDIKLTAQGGYEATITGTASGMSRAGMPYTSSVSDPLFYTKSCIESGVTIPNSGILKFLYSGIEVSVDYGDGSCDKNAIVFYPSGSKEITLD